MTRTVARRLCGMAVVTVACLAWAALWEPSFSPLLKWEWAIPWFYRLWWLAPAAGAYLAGLRNLRWEKAAAVGVAWLLGVYSFLGAGYHLMYRAGHAGVPIPHCAPGGDYLGAVLLFVAPFWAGRQARRISRRPAAAARDDLPSVGSEER
jgi:hypothetical protein